MRISWQRLVWIENHKLPGHSQVNNQDVVRVQFNQNVLAAAIDGMCEPLAVARGDIDRVCCHPGGVKVIDAIEAALRFNQGELNLEREVLRDYGNMSSPTVMFVLDRLLKQGLPDKVMMTAFGPGFTCAGLLLEAQREAA